VAVDDAMGQVLWTRHFLAAQGQHVLTTTIYQNNKSTNNVGRNWQDEKFKENTSH